MHQVFRYMSVGLVGLLGACASAANPTAGQGEGDQENVGSTSQALAAQCTELSSAVTTFSCNLANLSRPRSLAANSPAEALSVGYEPENAAYIWDFWAPASTPGIATAYVNFKPQKTGDWAVYHNNFDTFNVRVTDRAGNVVASTLRHAIPTCTLQSQTGVAVFPLIANTSYFIIAGPTATPNTFRPTIVNVDNFATKVYPDTDGDTFGNGASPLNTACKPPAGYVTTSNDCDDTRASVNPAAAEVCDGIDNNCDGVVDEGIPVSTFYRDVDGDGFGNAAMATSRCSAPAGYVAQGGDCNDSNAAIHPGAAEVCDGIDNNCSGAIDEGVEPGTYYADADGDGFGLSTSAVVACVRPVGSAVVGGDCDDAHASVHPGGTEVCDGLDNNCDGIVDDGVQTSYFRDTDGDGFGVQSDNVAACSAPSGYASAPGDCNDARADVHPGAAEVCDGVDNDCNGVSDEGVQTTFFQDADGDGYGVATTTVLACARPAGYAAVAGDCNDGNASVSPGAAELCDGTDNNCDGQSDEGLSVSTYYRDADGDGYGIYGDTIQSCRVVAGYAPLAGDCDDGNGQIKPGAPEVCDNVDNNCNGEIDDGIETAYYFRDSDGDGYGDGNEALGACAQPDGYVTNSNDCNDNDASIRPNAQEVCDGVDNNCNDQIDEGVAMTTYYRDVDGDGFGVTADSRTACAPPEGFVTESNDCNDKAPAVHPGAAEVCDQVDNDCDGTIDLVGGVSVCGLPPVTVTAAKSYSPWRWTNAVTNLPPHTKVAIPAEIPVTAGNAGSDFSAFATLDRTTGHAYACLYRGGSPVPNPKTPAQLQAGRTYKLLFCTGNKKGGDLIAADQVYLSVNGYAAAGKTEVSFSITPQ